MYNPEHLTIKYIKTFIESFPLDEQGAFDGGPAHIALSDYNLSDGNIEWCMQNIVKWLKTPETIKEYPAFSDFSTGRCIRLLGDTYCLLEILLEITEEKREVHQGPFTIIK